MKEHFWINDVAKILGVTNRTIINWENAKKIPKAKRDRMSNYRYYFKEDIAELKKITGRPL